VVVNWAEVVERVVGSDRRLGSVNEVRYARYVVAEDENVAGPGEDSASGSARLAESLSVSLVSFIPANDSA
jgi:hypothetical protein